MVNLMVWVLINFRAAQSTKSTWDNLKTVKSMAKVLYYFPMGTNILVNSYKINLMALAF